MDALDVPRTQVGVLTHAEGLQLAGVAGHDLFQVVGVSVGDADLTVAEKHPLALDVFLHALMLAGADVIRFQIGEDGIVVLEACHTAELHSLAGHLHDHIADASLHHLRKIFLHQEGFRRGVQGRDVLVTDDGFDGADQAGGQAGLFQDAPNHVGGGGLALGAGDPDGGQLFRRMAVPGGGQLSQSHTAVIHLEHGDIFRHLHVLLHHQRHSALFQHVRNVFVAVSDRTRQAEEDTAGNGLSRVVDDFSDVLFQAALEQSIIHTENQVDQFHISKSFLCHNAPYRSISPSNTVVAGPVIKMLPSVISMFKSPPRRCTVTFRSHSPFRQAA